MTKEISVPAHAASVATLQPGPCLWHRRVRCSVHRSCSRDAAVAAAAGGRSEDAGRPGPAHPSGARVAGSWRTGPASPAAAARGHAAAQGATPGGAWRPHQVLAHARARQRAQELERAASGPSTQGDGGAPAPARGRTWLLVLNKPRSVEPAWLVSISVKGQTFCTPEPGEPCTGRALEDPRRLAPACR